jgi:hypothetical protein
MDRINKLAKTFLKVQNLTLVIVLVVGIQNLSLKEEISELQRKIGYLDLDYDSSDIEDRIEEVERAVSAVAEYAEEAAQNSEKAARFAEDAYYSSFGANCGNCP